MDSRKAESGACQRVMVAKQGLLKTPRREGTCLLVILPLECLQRLAAPVSRPRLQLIRLHGVLAANVKLRAHMVSQEPEPPTQATLPFECEAICTHHRPLRRS